MSTEYIGMLLYDLPMKTAIDRRRYTRFHKALIGKGYYPIQESVYLLRSNTKEHILTVEKSLEIMIPHRSHVRSIILTVDQFKKMKILSGELTLGETIMRKDRQLLEF